MIASFVIFYHLETSYWIQSALEWRGLHNGTNIRRQGSLGAILEANYQLIIHRVLCFFFLNYLKAPEIIRNLVFWKKKIVKDFSKRQYFRFLLVQGSKLVVDTPLQWLWYIQNHCSWQLANVGVILETLAEINHPYPN